MSDLDTYLQRPETLMTAAVTALIDPASNVTISELDLTVDKSGTILIVPDPSTLTQPGWLYYGHAKASYALIDFATLLGSYDIRMMVTMPATTMDIVTIMNQMFNLSITSSDVVNEIIPALTQSGMTYLVKASPTSTMWTGQRAVRLYPVTLPPGA